MTIRRIRLALNALGVGLGVAIVATLMWGWFVPVAVPAPEEAPTKRPLEAAVDESPGLPTVEQFQAVLNKPLRRPLVDPPTSAVAKIATVARAEPSPPNLKLLGTVFESNQTFAILATAKGKIELRRVGERLGNTADGAEVMKIEPQRVELNLRGKPLTLELRRPPKTVGAGSGGLPPSGVRESQRLSDPSSSAEGIRQ